MSPLSNAIEPTTKAFLEALNAKSGPQIYELSVTDARAVLDDAQAGRETVEGDYEKADR